jgi:hypothetical protein
MRLRATLVALVTASCLAFPGVGVADVDPVDQLADDLSATGLQDVDLPAVPQVEVPHVGVPPVDDVVDTVNETLGGATDAVNDVTDSVDGGGAADPPAATPPADGASPAPQPVETGTPASPTTGGGGAPSDTVPGGDTGSSQPAAAGGGGAGDGAAVPASARRVRPANPSPPSIPDAPATTQSPFVTAFESLPMSLFAVIGALALLGLAMTGRSAARARVNRILRKQRGELQEDVGALQSALLPAIPERIGETELAVAYVPAEGPAAGGDFHDVVTLPDGRIGIVVGDVCGHGREALANTALVHYTVRAYLEAGLEPRESLRLANQALSDKLGEAFVTTVAAVYDPAKSTLDYATAGHPTPLLAGQPDRAVSVLTPPPIGIGLHTGHRQTRVSIRPGSRVWFFTDGLVEARGADGEMFGREGLAKVLAARDGAAPGEILEQLADDEGPRDDMTAFVLSPGAAHGDGVVEEEIDVDRELAVGDALPRFLAACGLEPAEVERAVEAAQRRLRLAGSARIRARSGGVGPKWEIFGATPSSGPAAVGRNGSAATPTVLAGAPG